jgi:hypothetical protein
MGVWLRRLPAGAGTKPPSASASETRTPEKQIASRLGFGQRREEDGALNLVRPPVSGTKSTRFERSTRGSNRGILKSLIDRRLGATSLQFEARPALLKQKCLP